MFGIAYLFEDSLSNLVGPVTVVADAVNNEDNVFDLITTLSLLLRYWTQILRSHLLASKVLICICAS